MFWRLLFALPDSLSTAFHLALCSKRESLDSINRDPRSSCFQVGTNNRGGEDLYFPRSLPERSPWPGCICWSKAPLKMAFSTCFSLCSGNLFLPHPFWPLGKYRAVTTTIYNLLHYLMCFCQHSTIIYVVIFFCK